MHLVPLTSAIFLIPLMCKEVLAKLFVPEKPRSAKLALKLGGVPLSPIDTVNTVAWVLRPLNTSSMTRGKRRILSRQCPSRGDRDSITAVRLELITEIELFDHGSNKR